MTDGCRYAFIVSRFPKMTETFIFREFLGLEERGIDFDLFSIIREAPDQLQPDAAQLDEGAHYMDWRSADPWTSQLHWIRRSPGTWLRAGFAAVRASRRNPKALIRVPMLLLVAGSMARRMEAMGTERLHVQWLTYPTLVAMVIKDLTGIPFSITAHAHDIWGETGNLEMRVRATDEIITCTDRGREVIIERVGGWAGDKVRVIHHGVDVSQFALEPLRVRGPDDPLRVLCVGVLSPYKGHRYLIEACRLLTDRGVGVELTLIGEGGERATLEALITTLGMDEQVKLLGRRPLAEVRAQLSACDAFALASIKGEHGKMDGIPNVLVEALAVGRPAVATRISGIPELIVDGESGLLTHERDPVSIADALERFARDPELVERVVAGGRAKVEAEHDSGDNLDLVAAELRSLCADRHGSGLTSRSTAR